jgi:hypothetical protein
LLRCMSPQLADFVAEVFFALVIKISFGCIRDFRVNVWATSLPDDKLAGDLGNVIEAIRIGGLWGRSSFDEKLSPSNFDFCNKIGTNAKCRGPPIWCFAGIHGVAAPLGFLGATLRQIVFVRGDHRSVR